MSSRGEGEEGRGEGEEEEEYFRCSISIYSLTCINL